MVLFGVLYNDQIHWPYHSRGADYHRATTMSLIKAIKAQLGLSSTPTNNFTLDASADNGTMKLARNSGQDILTVDSAGRCGFPQLANYADDTEAGAGGVSIGSLYRTGSTIKQRIS